MLPFLFSLFFMAIANTSHDSPTPKTTVTISNQEHLPHATLSIGAHRLDVELATNEASRERGLMKRISLGSNEGMLFVYPRAQQVAFWMKNTSLPLSIAYLASNGRILEIHDLNPFDEQSILSSSSIVAYALEVPRGWFSINKILPGDIVSGLPTTASAE